MQNSPKTSELTLKMHSIKYENATVMALRH